jgi:hypothetical protein
MNERIRELAEQAQLEHCVSHVRLQDFAELIVRECALVANEHNEQAEGAHLGVGRMIKEHFGVEE